MMNFADFSRPAGPHTVTYIVSTYNRPDTLEVALRSLVAQSHTNWRALVIGDNCTESTHDCIRAINDDRIYYLNLHRRCGEQSGPNSVGLALVTTPYVAFLNHDDILLSDHIEYGIGRLREENADFFFGKTAMAATVTETEHGHTRPLFDNIFPWSSRVFRDVCTAQLEFEPASAWIFKARLIRHKGLWRRSNDVFRTPLTDWLMRLCRNRPRFVFGERISVLWLQTHYHAHTSDKRPLFESRSPVHHYLAEFLAANPPDSLRSVIEEDLVKTAWRDRPYIPKWDRYTLLLKIKHGFASRLYFATGIDLYALNVKHGRGLWMGFDAKAASELKTGDSDFSRDFSYELLVDEVKERLGLAHP